MGEPGQPGEGAPGAGAPAGAASAAAAAGGGAPDGGAPGGGAPAGAVGVLPGSDVAERIATGYRFEGAAVELGSVVAGGGPHPSARVRVPIGMLNRHGLIAGATGTGKTKTLQLIAEQ